MKKAIAAALLALAPLHAGLAAPSLDPRSPQGPLPDGRERITEQECRTASFDFTARFTREQDQGSRGQCYAFAAAALFEEHGCATGRMKCGTEISPIDISRDYPDLVDPFTGKIPMQRDWKRDYFRLAYMNQGGVTDQILEAALDEGVCEAVHAPWFPPLPQRCRWIGDHSTCVIEGLKSQKNRYDRAMRRWARWSQDPEVRLVLGVFGKTRAERHAGTLSAILKDTRSFLPEELHPSDLKVEALLAEASDDFEFVQKALIPPRCAENRIRLQGTVWREDWARIWITRRATVQTGEDGSEITSVSSTGEKLYRSRFTNAERFKQLGDAITLSGRSAALGLCAESALVRRKARGDNALEPSYCKPHAVVANGLKWNEKKGQCEIHIRNSWGPASALRGWLPVEPILNSTMRISGILSIPSR
jgi:hypothetical protein